MILETIDQMVAVVAESKLNSNPMAMFAQDREIKDPRSETFFDMLRNNMCPQLTFFSFAVLFSILITVFFFAQAGVDGIDRTRIAGELIPINLDGPISSNLSNKAIDIKEKYQIYRPLTSLIIHTNLYHVFSNAIMLIIWASYFEVYLTTRRTPIMFVLSGVLGNLFAASIQGAGSNSLGASTGIFGIMGAAVGFLAFNWKNMDYQGSQKNFFMCQLGFILIFSLLFVSSGDNVTAHLGGLLAGVFVGMFVSVRHISPEGQPIGLTSYEKTVRNIGIGGAVIIFVVCLSVILFA